MTDRGIRGEVCWIYERRIGLELDGGCTVGGDEEWEENQGRGVMSSRESQARRVGVFE